MAMAMTAIILLGQEVRYLFTPIIFYVGYE